MGVISEVREFDGETGRLRPVKGLPAMAVRCRDDGVKGVHRPGENAEAAAVRREPTPG